MTSLSTQTGSRSPLFAPVFGGLLVCWLVAAFVHLYYFGYASMDSWCYCAPAATAKAPLALTTPFLGTFEGANKAWGLHWPGGLLVTSLVTPFLPRHPATYMLISIFYWLLESLAAMTLVKRLTGSAWLALCGFVLVASDRICFSVTWFERYELLGGAIAMTAVMAVCNRAEGHWGRRAAVIGLMFFLLPLIHPVYSGVGLALLGWLGIRTFATGSARPPFWAAAAGYAAGWAGFVAYYGSRPWLYAEFRNHARQNLEITRTTAPPGIHTFLLHLSQTDRPTRAGAFLYLVAFGGVIWLLIGLFRSGGKWREFLVREDLGIFSAIGLVSALGLSQTTYNPYYWATAWPFAVAVACLVAHWLLERFPKRQRLVAGALVVVLLLHGSYWAGRTYIWYKTGWANLRGMTSEFAQSLPQGGQLFIPEVLWDNFAAENRTVFLNALAFTAGDEKQASYAAYIGPLMRSGDVLVIDNLASHPCLIDPRQAGWKELGHCKLTYQGEDKPHGFDMTAYQKEW